MTEIRPAGPADAPLLAELRGVMQQGNGVGAEQIARDLATWQAWFAGVLASGDYVAWVAEVDCQSAGTVGLMFFPQIPSAADPRTRRPQVANVAVRPEFRRRGLAGQLLDTALAWARAEGYRQVGLNAAPMGRELYHRAGFTVNDNPAMTLKL